MKSYKMDPFGLEWEKAMFFFFFFWCVCINNNLMWPRDNDDSGDH